MVEFCSVVTVIIAHWTKVELSATVNNLRDLKADEEEIKRKREEREETACGTVREYWINLM